MRQFENLKMKYRVTAEARRAQRAAEDVEIWQFKNLGMLYFIFKFSNFQISSLVFSLQIGFVSSE
jgi:hypothetical protein